MNNYIRVCAAAIALLAVTAGCNHGDTAPPTAVEGSTTPTAAGPGKMVTTSTGLMYQDLIVGTGPSPTPGQNVTVSYIGTLENGQKFDASADHGGTFSFLIGQGQVIKGWDEGVMSMKVGGKRNLTIPSDLAYGPNGMPPVIPANATLHFQVILVGVK